MRRAALLACALLGCGGAPAASPLDRASASASASGTFLNEPCWPVAPMRIVERGRTAVEMSGDGSMTLLVGDERRFLGRVSNDAVLDAHEMPTLTCVHREVGVPGTAPNARYDASDAYASEPMKVAVGDDGAVTVTLPGHAPERLPDTRVEGPLPRARRTAELLVMLRLARGRD